MQTLNKKRARAGTKYAHHQGQQPMHFQRRPRQVELNPLEHAIEFTHQQLSWSNKNTLGKVYLLCGYFLCAILTIFLIVIIYYGTHHHQQSSRTAVFNNYNPDHLVSPPKDHLNVSKMIYWLENDPAAIDGRVKASSNR